MLDLLSTFERFSPDIDVADAGVDGAFIVDFLKPFFAEVPREKLAATLAEVVLVDQRRQVRRR